MPQSGVLAPQIVSFLPLSARQTAEQAQSVHQDTVALGRGRLAHDLSQQLMRLQLALGVFSGKRCTEKIERAGVRLLDLAADHQFMALCGAIEKIPHWGKSSSHLNCLWFVHL